MESPIRCALAPLPGTARVHGMVVDWNGIPSPAFVRLFEGEKQSWDRSRGTSAGLDGRYEVDHVPPSLSPSLGGIHGRISDTGSGEIPGATATLRGAGRTLEAISDARGIYAFPDLLPGQYELRVSLSGFRTHMATITVIGGRWSSGDATLEVGPIPPTASQRLENPGHYRDPVDWPADFLVDEPLPRRT